MFTKEERLFIWKKVYEMIDRLEDGEYICVALRNVVFMYFKTHKNIYEFRSDEMVRIYFPELEEKISMATEPEETRTFYGWFGCLSPETKYKGVSNKHRSRQRRVAVFNNRFRLYVLYVYSGRNIGC